MIDKVGYTKPSVAARAAAIKRAGGADAATFAAALSKAESALGAEGTAALEGTNPTAAMTGTGSLLGLQEVSEAEAQRRKSLKKGRLTLDALVQLRDAMLIGSLPLTVLRNLEKLVAQERAMTMDPRLEAIINEIDVRAAVEIAKLEMSGINTESRTQE